MFKLQIMVFMQHFPFLETNTLKNFYAVFIVCVSFMIKLPTCILKIRYLFLNHIDSTIRIVF